MVKKKAIPSDLNRIGKVLKEKGVTAYRVHKDTGIAADLIYQYIKNERQPSLLNLFRVARAVDVAVSDLIND